MLALEGIPTRSLSAKTPPDARRQAVRDFKDGAVRVLTNYRILAEGFDAPGARAVVISRPVFSRNIYQQIVGRGLRGPLNGGKERCLIVDVEDNHEQFGGQLAFQHFDYLWEQPMQSAADEEQDLAVTYSDVDLDRLLADEVLDVDLDRLLADEVQDLHDWLEGQADSD